MHLHIILVCIFLNIQSEFYFNVSAVTGAEQKYFLQISWYSCFGMSLEKIHALFALQHSKKNVTFKKLQ